MRALKHLLTPHWLALRAFPSPVLEKIESAIKASERQHDGELRFVVEAGLPFGFLKQSTRKRAEALFAQLGVWDTAHNSGVLVYVQLVDRRIEIVADRGIAAKVGQEQWSVICSAMEVAFRKGHYLEGSLLAVESVTQVLARHFPPRGRNPNELPDKPTVL
ncbi:MAG TPA: TPM domain-containing protein [Burkholderiales bacterium]|nr:TPM domain-containing protein [Burkholderiales bacterium]